MTAKQTHSASNPAGARVLEIELLALDLTTCTRCTGTLANIERAIEVLRPVTALTGTAIHLRKIVVGSEEEARRHRFTSSPTVRVDGRDIVFETLESACDSCSDLCGCREGTSCRVWRYRGEELEEAPVGLVIEALLKAIAGAPDSRQGVSEGEEVPENLRRFFAGRAERAAAEAGACCPPAQLANCCPPAEKASCCDPAAASCGCA